MRVLLDGVSWKRLLGAVEAALFSLVDDPVAPFLLSVADALRAESMGAVVVFLIGTVTVRWRILLGLEANMSK